MCSILAGVLACVFYVPYIWTMLTGKTKPVIVSWIVWSINDTALALSMYTAEGLSGFMLGSSVGCIITCVLSFKYGKFDYSAIDITCAILSCIGIGIGIYLKEPRVVILISLLVAVLSSMPTIRSAMKNPEDENRAAWLIYYTATWCSILGLERWTFATAATPMTFMVLGTYCQYLLWRPRRNSPQ